MYVWCHVWVLYIGIWDITLIELLGREQTIKVIEWKSLALSLYKTMFALLDENITARKQWMAVDRVLLYFTPDLQTALRAIWNKSVILPYIFLD